MDCAATYAYAEAVVLSHKFALGADAIMVDVPAFLVVVDALAGEFEHAPLKSSSGATAICLDVAAGAMKFYR
jgi:thymidine phosphorylase